MTAIVGHVGLAAGLWGQLRVLYFLSRHCGLLGLGFGPLGVALDWLLVNRGLGLGLGFYCFLIAPIVIVFFQ